jgi:hypothetical protein
MEKRDDQFLNDFIEKNDGLLKERWQSAMGHLTQRLSQFTPESRVFNEVKKLILNLVSLVQSTGSAEQAVDLELKPIVSQLRALQSENQLTHAEMVLFLFFARDFLKDILKDLVGSTPQGGKSDPPFMEGLNQDWSFSRIRCASRMRKPRNRMCWRSSTRFFMKEPARWRLRTG